MNRILRILAVGALSLPGLGYAEGLDYTFIEGGYLHQDFDDLNFDGEGYSAHAGLALDPKWHMFADYSKTNIGPVGNTAAGALDVQQVFAGFGYNHHISETFHAIGRLGWADAKFGKGSNAGNDGWGAQVLLRSMVLPNLDLEGGVQHIDLGSSGGDDTSFVAAARYHITSWFSVGVNGATGGDVTQYGLNIRFNLKDSFAADATE